MSTAAVPFIGLGAHPAQERLAESAWAGGAWSTTSAVNFTMTPTQFCANAETFLNTTGAGANAVTTPSALQILTQIQALLGFRPPVGFTFMFEIQNTGNNTVTLTAGAGVTINGTATALTSTNRLWLVSITDNRDASAAVTIQNMGSRSN